ncbi:MAG: thioredoxin [Bacteroidales bacterium]|jgi:thioredoxin 1|nr:thioredoxin [Bacteroidales bacterium]
MAIHITDENWEATVKEGAVILDFWAEWCAPCRALLPLIEEMAQTYEGKVVIGKVNVDESPNVTLHFGIKNIPTLLFFKDGNMVDKQVGNLRKSDLVKKIEQLL